MLMAGTVHAQKDYTTYKMSYTGLNYDISVGDKDQLFLDIMSLDKLHSKVGLLLTTDESKEFMRCIDSAEKKFVEWKAIAIKNGVKDFSKELDVTFNCNGYFHYGDWEFDRSVNPTFEFMVINSSGITKYLMVMRTGEMISSTNEFIKTDGGAIVFSTAAEFKALRDKIKPENVTKFFETKPKTEELFK